MVFINVENGVYCQTLQNNCVAETETVQTFTLFYLTLPEYLRFLLWIKVPEPKREEAGAFPIYDHQKLQRLYTRGGTAYGSVRNLVKASRLPASKVRQFLHSKPSQTKLSLATRKWKGLKSIAQFKKEIRCMDLAYVDELAKIDKGVTNLLVLYNLFDWTVDAKWMITKDSKGTLRAVSLWLQKNRPKNVGSTKEQNLPEITKKIAELRDYNFNLRWVRIKLHLLTVQNGPWKTYFTLHGRLWIQVHSPVLSYRHRPEFEKNCSIDLIPKNILISDFLSIFYSKPLREYRKPKIRIGYRVRISNYDSPLRKGYKPQFTQDAFEIVVKFCRKPPTYTIKDEQDKIIRGEVYQINFYQSQLTMESFTIELVSNASAQLFPANTLGSYTDFLTDQPNLEGQCDVAHSELSYSSMYQNVTEENFMFFDEKPLISSEIYNLEPGRFLHFHYGYC